MSWPPVKSWTSTSKINGFKHFVAINYGGKGNQRWVNLVSVLDGRTIIKVLWHEIKDSSRWISGWEQLPREDSLPSLVEPIKFNDLKKEDFLSYLSPSDDSGLLIPSNNYGIRPWV